VEIRDEIIKNPIKRNMSGEIIKINVKVQPNAHKNEMSGFNDGIWRVKIAAPPDKGKANRELILFFSDLLGVKKDDISLLKGLTSHNKIIGITGLTQEAVVNRLKTATE
jgi:uncharacterized protein (TIGR00251 family)